MRRIVTQVLGLAVLIAACSPPAAPTTGTPADEQAIRQLATGYADAWNKKDAKALSAMMTDDYEEVTPMSGHLMGRAAFEKMTDSMMKSMPAELNMSMTVSTAYVKWLSGTSAVMGGTWEMASAPPGIPNKGTWMVAAVKQDTTWKVASSLSADAPPPMAAPDTTKKTR